ncbi:hypothetical protein I545_3417 [Mycobacterium kansasii 662]|nr:hypothetical protein I547_6041 [Mycobacterium kansasii 824]EUA17902.1 hypothetical protein I545_3417 [Mycobacterium kansasii 662]OOK74673.1 hypothetical protein BZL29_4310 [Mycobacterium kansasii]
MGLVRFKIYDAGYEASVAETTSPAGFSFHRGPCNHISPTSTPSSA